MMLFKAMNILSRRLLYALQNIRILKIKFRFATRYGGAIRLIGCSEPRESTNRWSKLPSLGFQLTVIAVAYKQPEAMACFLHSMNCQTLQSFKVHLLHDGPDAASHDAIELFSPITRFPLIATFTGDRYNDWGHSLRSLGLHSVDTEYVLLTNADNYYVPRFVEYALDVVEHNQLDLLYWDMIHSHDHPGNRMSRSYQTFETELREGSIDIGAFLVRTAIAKQVGFVHRDFAADGSFLVDLLRSGKVRRVGYLDKVMFVHN